MSNDILLTLPLLIALCGIVSQWWLRRYPLLGCIGHLVMTSVLLLVSVVILCKVKAAGILVTNVGNWPAPFGINLVLDKLSSLFLLVFSFIIWLVSFYQFNDPQVKAFSTAYGTCFWLLVLGVVGSISTGDLFNLYVWFEVIMIAAFILLSLSTCENKQARYRYLALNLVGTLCLLLAIALIYGITGTLNMADITRYLAGVNNPDVILPPLLLLVFSVSLKAGLFPLYFWLPDAYAKTATSTTALFSGLITKLAMVLLFRFVLLWWPLQHGSVLTVLLVVAWLTMVLGVFGAAIQFDFKRILSFHIISQIGYILLGYAINTRLALIAALYFLIHNVLVKTNLFLVSGFAEQYCQTNSLKKLGDWLSRYPVLTVIFFLSAFSLAGFPPLSGFWAKFLLIKASIDAHYWYSAAIAIFVSLFTLYSMTKIWNYVFCQPTETPHQGSVSSSTGYLQYFSMIVLLLAALGMAFYPDPLLHWLEGIYQQYSHPVVYAKLILGGR